jgi:hypothetical protein
MSYLSQAQLSQDPDFQSRTAAVAVEQANTFKDDQRPDFVALSTALLKGSSNHMQAFVRMNSAGPGIGEKVDNGDGTIDQSQVTDGDLLSLTQSNYPVVVDLYFNLDGSIKY